MIPCHAPRTVALAAALMSLSASGTPAGAQEFDCRAASTSAERAICASERLSSLDERMTQLYDRLWSVLGDDEAREGLRDDQRMFLAARDRCGRTQSCIRGAYLDQIEVLKARLRFSDMRRAR